MEKNALFGKAFVLNKDKNREKKTFLVGFV